ncbi:MAG: nucleotidyltransferase domain-containing protein [Clostridia bacterium]|nr:nucleotidyltransferase domain-containing protein [Clostridia bacterium]
MNTSCAVNKYACRRRIAGLNGRNCDVLLTHFDQINEIIKDVLPLGPSSIVLFGSCARSEDSWKSDVDVLVVGDDLTLDQILPIRGKWTDTADIVFSQEDTYKESKQLFYRDIRNEGVVLWQKA